MTPSTASSGRIAQLLRWLGLTLVVLMGLQLTPLLVNWNWDLEPFRQVFLDRLVGEGPMALVGLLLMLVAQRLEGPSSRTPLRWLAGVLAALLAIAMVVAVPLSLNSEAALAQEAQQQEAAIAQQAMQLEMQKQQVEDPAFVDQLIAEAEKEGRIPPQATDAEKKKRAREFIDSQIRPQLEQAEKQVAQARFARNLGLQQRRFGVTGRAVALAVAFVLVAVVALV
ncbi:HpsJ family protein [Cyanobium sp. CH-040]|uniref:HpsJ family protein n=1 Tax=Cyanobium sp. CH-040 TaxID=2823708 RepID=UPI0020CB79BF|nr:HpsJ family protein [Cyanobium sp. CH-040]